LAIAERAARGVAGGGAGAGNVVPVAPAAVVPAVVNTGGAPGARTLAAGVLSHRQPNNKIFSTTVSQLGKVMTQVADQLHLGVLGAPHPYRLRHTGASRDCLQKNRGLVDIQSRGRWKSAASFRRYQKGGRIQQQLQSLPRDVLGLALDAAKKRSSDLRNLRC